MLSYNELQYGIIAYNILYRRSWRTPARSWRSPAESSALRGRWVCVGDWVTGWVGG